MSSQSLPSFAQAFSAIDDRERALPPIHSHSPYIRNDHRHDSISLSHTHHSSLPPLKRDNRKRQLERDDDSEPESPRIVKQEQDVDQLDPSPPPPSQKKTQTKSPPGKAPSPARPTTRTRQQLHLNTNVANTTTNNNSNNANTANANTTSTNTNAHVAPPPPPPSLTRQQQQHPPSKRRRVTISGVAHPSIHSSSTYASSPVHSNAHTPPPGGATHTGPSTPISPVVMGFTIQRDPQAVEQVRAMLAVKQKQKALIESRRGSAAGLAGADGVSGRRGSTAGVLDGGSGLGSGRRASVAAPSVTVNVVNPTPTTATGPGPAVAPPLRRTGSSPNGHRLMPTPPSHSPKTRTVATRTRSPTLLGGARAKSPSPHGVANQSRAGPPPPLSTVGSNLSPPSHHPQPQTQTSPRQVSARTHNPSSPYVGSGSNSGAGSASAAQPPSSSPHLNTAANTNSNTNSQGQQGSSSGSTQAQGGQSQNQAPSSSSSTFVASQGFSALAHNLPPPPNSFTRRRAGQLGLRGNKPADLMISPRDSESGPNTSGHKTSVPQQQHQHPPPLTASQSRSQSQVQGQGFSSLRRGMQMPSAVPVSASLKSLQPAIQSAPPRPGQQPGRFPMALPSLPPAMGRATAGSITSGLQPPSRGTSVRKSSGQVPPTPTRLSMQRVQATTESASVRLSQPTSLSRVPRTATGATFAILHGPAESSSGTGGGTSMSLMPATPATFHRASTSSTEKAAFLAPFEQFYDALSDAQVLKGWFGEQLRRVGALAKEGEAQITKLKAANSNEPSGSGSPSGGSGLMSKAEVENLVREAIATESRNWRDEISRLRAQVAELQDLLERERDQEKLGRGAGVGRPVTPSPRPLFQPTPPTSSASVSMNAGPPAGVGGYPTAPGVDSYTFPPVQAPRPPAGPGSTPSTYGGSHSHAHQHSHGPPPPSSGIMTLMDERERDRERVIALRRSVSPPFHGRDTSEGAGSLTTYRGGGTRSLSRSAASSPAPSMDGSLGGGVGLGSGIGRRLSVSAMRFERLERTERTEGKGISGIEDRDKDKDRTREQERERDREARPEVRRANSYSAGGATAAIMATKSIETKSNGNGNGGGSGEGSNKDRQEETKEKKGGDAMDEG